MERFHNDSDFLPGGQRATGVSPYVLGALISAVWFCLAVFLALNPDLFDLPLTKLINHFAGRSRLLDMTFYDLDHYAILCGLPLMSLIWYCWFETDSLEEHASILVGTLIAFPIGMVSRFLQHMLPTHPRPFYDPLLGFHHPSMLPAEQLNTWNSFPSDHATAFGALVAVIVIQRPKLAWLVLPWFLLLESARTYMGAHYPSDLIGGLALAVTVILAVRAPRMIRAGEKVVEWGRSHPSLFYMGAFFVSTQIATLFLEFRYIVGGVTLLELLKFW